MPNSCYTLKGSSPPDPSIVEGKVKADQNIMQITSRGRNRKDGKEAPLDIQPEGNFQKDRPYSSIKYVSGMVIIPVDQKDIGQGPVSPLQF